MKTKLFGIISLTALMTSCATYFITPQNLQSVLEKGKPQIGITQVNAVDKDGNPKVLSASMQTGIRITKKDDTRQTFYFITAFLKDSSVMGSKSAIFNIPIKPIKISEIKMIEFDGR